MSMSTKEIICEVISTMDIKRAIKGTNMVFFWVRAALTTALICGIYRETGIFTAIGFFLVMMALEIIMTIIKSAISSAIKAMT